jgi:hypothetical protein
VLHGRRATRAATGAGQLVGSGQAALGLLMTLNGRWDGLWLVIVGWFLTGAAAGERARAVVVQQLEGLTAAPMTHAPHAAPEWWTVQAFPDGPDDARRRDPALPRHRAFPRHGLRGRRRGYAAPP